MNPFTYIVPGICTDLEDPRTWDYQAQLWMHQNGYGLAAGFNYYAGILGGLISRDTFAAMVQADLLEAGKAGFAPIDVVAHSNGCAIVLRALLKDARIRIRRLHLIAAAVPCDCGMSGLNAIANVRQAEEVVLYVSPKDEALGIGQLLGYGDLGRKGPSNLQPMLAGMLRRIDRDCGHSDWVGRDFEQTMRQIVGDDTPVQWPAAAGNF